jgi:uncharacterized membrane protein YjdF
MVAGSGRCRAAGLSGFVSSWPWKPVPIFVVIQEKLLTTTCISLKVTFYAFLTVHNINKHIDGNFTYFARFATLIFFALCRGRVSGIFGALIGF